MNLAVAESSETDWRWIALFALLAVAGYAVMFFTNPAYPSFRDGFRSLKRYPRMGLWLAFLGVAYFVFQVIQSAEVGEIRFAPSDLIYWPDFRLPDFIVTLNEAWIPSLEWLAGVFNQGVACYPISAIAAVLFLLNWHGYQGQILLTARARLKGWWIWIYAGLLLCAAAAVAKPVFALSIWWLNRFYGGILLLRVGAVIDWLSFQFEYLFGTSVQIYLILLTFVWIRGLNSPPARVFEFAITRAVYVAKWVGVMLAATALFIHLPLLASYLWIAQQTDFMSSVVEYIDQTARPLLSVGLIFFCSMQINLTLQNRTLQEAILAHSELARRYWYRIGWFLLVAGFHLLAITWLSRLVVDGFPVNSVPALLSRFAFAVIKGFAAAWCLAAWVCLYRKTQQPARGEVRF